MLRVRALQRPPSCPTVRGPARAVAPPRVRSAPAARSASACVAPRRYYAKARAAQPTEDEATDADSGSALKLDEEEEDKDKKQQVVPGPVPLSFWYTSDKTYIDENFMRARDIYRITTFDLQEAVRLRAKEFELHLDEFKRRLRAPQLTEYLKLQQKAVAEYRPVLRAAMKERRQARKDYNLGIDKKIEDERTATREELQKMANTEGAKNVKEMNEHLQTILVKSLEDRINRLSGLAHEPIAEELLTQPPDIFERELFEDQLPSTPKDGSNILDNMLMSDWFPDAKHLDTGADTALREWHSRKDFLRSHAKLNAYGLRTHPISDGPPPKDWHEKQTAALNRHARQVAEKLAMPEYLRLPVIPKDATPEKREHLVKMQLLVHQARRLRLAIYRRELDTQESRERLQELKSAVDDPTGFAAFAAATPVDNNYQLAALLIQLEQAQQLAVKGDIKREDLIQFPEAVSILRRIVKERNIPFTLIPPENITVEAPENLTPSEVAEAAAGTDAPATEGAAPAAAGDSPQAAADSAVKEPEEPLLPQKQAKTREPLPPLPRLDLQQKLSPAEVESLEKELRDLEVAELRLLPNASDYIDELRNMVNAYSGEELDYSFLDKDYDVEISHRYSLFPELPNAYGKKVKQMHERRVRMLVKVESLGLPLIVKKRLIEIAGPRYDAAADKLIITSDSKTSSFQNIRYAKKLLQRLIAEAYLAHPRYISMDDLTPPKPAALAPKVELPKQLPLKFGIFRFRRPLYLDSDWDQLKASAPAQLSA